MPMPDPNSFYSLLMNNEAMMSRDGRLFHTTLDTLTKQRGLPLARYQQIPGYAHLTDEHVIHVLFDGRNDAQRKRCIGNISRDAFTERFENGLGLYQEKMDRLVDVFSCTSFPETYFHPQIAQVLHGSGKLMNPNSAARRVGETALIMVQAMGAHCLATMALIGASHLMRNVRGKTDFNSDTVEFTLLTFSYFGAKRSGVKEEDWFFYWRVFGSLMGLGPDRLHDNFDQAAGRMAELHRQCPSPPTQHSKALLDVFIGAFQLTTAEIGRYNAKGLISKRLHAYLVSANLWPEGVFRTKGVVDDA
jgi:hypothetical protein